MTLGNDALSNALDALAATDASVANALEQVGYPESRSRPRGHRTLLRIIVGQQVSVASATSVWEKLEAELGPNFTPACFLKRDVETLRACGLSRQKLGYMRSLCELVEAGAVNLDALPECNRLAVEQLTRMKGIGRWSAEVYLLFAEGRRDVWPAGDVAVQEGVKRLLGLVQRPDEEATREIGERWSPHRGAMAVFLWHYCSNSVL
jgi:DNA-3-methyladenine glycosylase II